MGRCTGIISADYPGGVETPTKGTAKQLRQVNRYGDHTQDDDVRAGLFWKNGPASMTFLKAFENQDMAKIALRDYAMEGTGQVPFSDGRAPVHGPNASGFQNGSGRNQDALSRFLISEHTLLMWRHSQEQARALQGTRHSLLARKRSQETQCSAWRPNASQETCRTTQRGEAEVRALAEMWLVEPARRQAGTSQSVLR